MSADNYMVVKEKGGEWHVWMALGGYHDDDWKVPSKPYFTSTDKLRAIEWAHDYCSREIVEYGVVLLSKDEKGSREIY